MNIDSDRCHFCGSWTKEYKKIGDRAICEGCFKELIEELREGLQE